MRGPASLPSGLGAGGRGKEKAPCRYLHYEVDWDATDGDGSDRREKTIVKNTYKIGIGLGPTRKAAKLVSLVLVKRRSSRYYSPIDTTTMDQL